MTKSPVALTKPVDVDSRVRLSLTRIRPVQVTAVGPGEIAGPALAVTVHVDNRSSRPIDLEYAAVNVIGSDGQVGNESPESPAAAPFPARVAPGAAADGTYVFQMPTSVRNPINVYVSYTAGGPTAHFHGNAS